jgi:hypothetical protein
MSILVAHHLLNELSTASQQQSTHGLRAAFTLGSLAAKELGPGYSIGFLVLASIDDFLVLSNDEWIVFGFVFKIGKYGECLVLVLMSNQPPW